jgi:hypothetical protein
MFDEICMFLGWKVYIVWKSCLPPPFYIGVKNTQGSMKSQLFETTNNSREHLILKGFRLNCASK